jgi:hypothetical protein
MSMYDLGNGTYIAGPAREKPMNLVVLDKCPACGNNAEYTWVKACSLECARVNARQFIDATTHHGPRAASHLHVTCNQCDFTWLAPVDDEEMLKGAW